MLFHTHIHTSHIYRQTNTHTNVHMFQSYLYLSPRQDIWLFLGGAGVFFVFMFIITIDDDIKYKDRREIAVF